MKKRKKQEHWHTGDVLKIVGNKYDEKENKQLYVNLKKKQKTRMKHKKKNMASLKTPESM